jgi:cytochrome P450
MTPLDLSSGDTYVDGPPHDYLAHLRLTQPVVWQDMADGTGYWAVLRHADCVEVSRRPDPFSAHEGGVVIEDLEGERLVMMRKMLLAMDPPEHIEYRKQISGEFKARVIAQLEPRIRMICRSIMADAAEMRDVDFVHDVCAHLPSQVIGELMGLPREDWPRVHDMAERNSGGQDPDINPDPADRGKSSVEMAMYAMEFAAARRAAPDTPEDLTSVILHADFNGSPLTDVDFAAFFVQLVTAGNDTTRTMLSSGLDALLRHPAQLEALRADRSLIPGAVEEILRWANPLHYFRRTAIADARIGDVTIEAGQKLAMIYTSANRDEAVFADPQRFDITRDPNPHLSFGIGEHFCLGVHLARLEGRVFFDELLNAFSTIERTGEPARQRSNLNNSFKLLPVRLS